MSTTARGERTVELTVDGENRAVEVEDRTLLSDALRSMGCFGVHVGCEHGICGACTVLVDGVAVRSCLTFTASVEGREVTTIHGITPEVADAIAHAFSNNNALQCGFCTPGFMILAAELVQSAVPVSDDDLDAAVGSNLCRCTGYQGLRKAFRQLASGEPT